MKTLTLTLAVFLFSFLIGIAQVSPRGFNFQAVARNDDGSPKANTSIDIVFGIYPNSTSNDPLYREKHTVTTDQFGVFSATIGNGTVLEGVEFTKINYEYNDCELAVWQIDAGTEVIITRTRLLSVPYAKYASQAYFPAGIIVPFAGPVKNVPPGWMLCDGRGLKIENYPALFAAIGTSWGDGSENCTGGCEFNVPDLRGTFLRGRDGGRGFDPDTSSRTTAYAGGNSGSEVGSFQSDTLKSHTHWLWYNDNSWPDDPYDQRENLEWNSIWTKDEKLETTSSGGMETRPKNVYVNYIIKL